ncbi:HAD family hydrolase [Mesoflavibacter zeaxanthinifaciens]|uniref:HAD family hydrolase n=1 Tax=Mesoflavibacter zeaxanthinifaciens TaxID=393060 RepID=UPI0026F1A799|nr:HAD family hydrolase [Mesoflavibacter zeaxanthinifaciens]
MNSLCLLDLDHTLIYGSYAPSEKAEFLFEYNEYLKVYKRPFVEEFINFLNRYYTHIIVYTTAKEDYANRICLELNIDAFKIFTRQDCKEKNDRYYKAFQHQWGHLYDKIDIIDDSPNVWLSTDAFESKIRFIVPKEFRGELDDNELTRIIKVISLEG